MRRKVVSGLAFVLIVLCVAGVMMANSEVIINWDVIAGGGGQASSGIYTLNNTIGQAATGLTDSGSFDLCAGYWCMKSIGRPIYLPVVLRITE